MAGKIPVERYYFDSAYVAKCYLEEPDAGRVRALVGGGVNRHTSELSLAEVACTFHRHLREKRLTLREALRLRGLFLEDVEDGLWELCPLSPGLLRRVEALVLRLPPHIFLRAGDAIHLLSAREAGFSDIWSSDRRLLAAARHFGLRARSV